MMLLRGWYPVHCPLVIEACVRGIVKRSSSDFMRSWDSWWTNAIFTSRRKISLRVSSAVDMFSVSCLEANCYYPAALSFLYLFTTTWLRRILGRYTKGFLSLHFNRRFNVFPCYLVQHWHPSVELFCPAPLHPVSDGAPPNGKDL